MTDVARLLLVVALGLGVTAASVFGAGDARILTPPPENAAEAFFDLFAVQRHKQALAHVDASYRETVSPDSLVSLHRRIARRLGEFKVSETKRLWINRDRAAASVTLKSRTRPSETIEVPLIRKNGVWRVSDLRPLSDVAR